MATETITITIPDSPKEREEILSFLATKGLVSQNRASRRSASPKGKYAELARQYREEEILTGYGKEVAKLRKEFREDFTL